MCSVQGKKTIDNINSAEGEWHTEMEFLDKQSENQYQNMIVRVNQLQNSNSTEHLYAEFSSRRAQENLYQCLETTSLKNVNCKSVTTV